MIAPGKLVVDSNVKKVQHPTGGVVGELRVRDGDQVKAGDIVVRLDDTVTRANLAIVTKGLDELAARQARLEAERDGDGRSQVSGRAPGARRRPDVARASWRASASCSSCAAGARGPESAAARAHRPVKEEIRGLERADRRQGKRDRADPQELEGVRELWRKNLVPITRSRAGARRGAARGRARRANRRDRSGQGQDHRDPTADHADRPGPAQRGRARSCRDPTRKIAS